jgi:hypothetical protein
MFQICGALAEEGRSLEEIVKIAKNATTKMGKVLYKEQKKGYTFR